MATIKTSGALDNTNVYSNLTISVKSRTSSKVTFSYTITTYLNSGGYTMAGYESYIGKIAISGKNITSKAKSVTLKDKAIAWSGSTKHTIKGTITVSTSTYAKLNATIKYTVTSSADSTNSNNGSTTLSISAYDYEEYESYIPTSVTAKSENGGTSKSYIDQAGEDKITVTAVGAIGAAKYVYQISKNGANYVTLGTTSSKTYTYYPSFTKAGETIRFRVYIIDAGNNMSDSARYSNTITAAYRTPIAPSRLTATTDVSNNIDLFYVGYDPDTLITLEPYGGYNVKSYEYQVSKNGGEWITCSNRYPLSGLSDEDTLQFRTCGVGWSGEKTSYVTSSTFYSIYRYSEPPTKLTVLTDKSQSSTEIYVGYNADSFLSISVEGGTNVSEYLTYISLNGGEWIYQSGSIYTLMNKQPGDTVQVRACVVGLAGRNSDYIYSPVLTVKYAIDSVPTDLTINSDCYLPGSKIGLSWNAPAEAVSGYKVQYQVNGGWWNDLDDTIETSVEYSDIVVPFRQTLAFRVAAYNDEGFSPFVVSDSITCNGGLLVKSDGEYKVGDVYVMVNGEWKRGTVYIKIDGEWKVST